MLPAALTLALTLIPAGYLYLPAKAVRVGELVCDHPEPYVYCAVKGDALFEFELDDDHSGGWCPLHARSETPRYPYRLRPIIQWVPVRIGRDVCWTVGFQRRGAAAAGFMSASRDARMCARSTNDHVEMTGFDELPVEGSGPLAVRIAQEGLTNPVEILGVYLDIDAVYP